MAHDKTIDLHRIDNMYGIDSDSPLLRLLVCMESVAIVAPNRFSASSKDVRVRVEFSKKRLAMVMPLRSWVSGNGSVEFK